MMDMKIFLTLVFIGLLDIGCGKPSQSSKENAKDISDLNSKETPSHEWDYDENGPETWGEVNKNCVGKKQSPINIVTCETEAAGTKSKLFEHNYNELFEGNYSMVNNGHALQIDLPPDNNYRLLKGYKTYTPLQVHMHFNPDGKGSEHTLNSKQYFAEIHIVHKNSDYVNDTYMLHRDGLLVIGIFVDIVEKVKKIESDLDFALDNDKKQIPNNGNSFAVQLFARVAKKCSLPTQKASFEAFPLAWLLPKVDMEKSTNAYVNYHGSLTTPPCAEIVDWFVITGKLLQANKWMANEFRRVKNNRLKPMGGNFRPIQDLNGRPVYGVKGSLG